MGLGIDWMIAVTLWVAALPGAVGHISAFGTGALLIGTAGLMCAASLIVWSSSFRSVACPQVYT